jgi:HEAT repeat protein
MKPAGAREGLRALARSLGSAATAVRRAFAQPRAGVAAAVKPSAALGRLLVARRQVKSDVAKLQAELDRLHALITSQPLVSHDADHPPAAQLDGLIRRARSIRDRLQEKRDEQLRIERHLARERWLRSQEARPAADTARPRAAPRRAKTRRAATVREMLSKISPADRSEPYEVRRLGEDFSSRDPEVRRKACTRLGSFDSPSARKLLLMALDDPSERVQLAALNALAGTRTRASIAAFRRFLRSSSAPLRLAALRALAAVDARLLDESETSAALQDQDAAIRRAAATIMGWRRERQVRDPQAFRALTLALHDGDATVRVAAIEALGSSGDDRSVFPLIGCLADADEPVRAAAEQSLRAILGPALDAAGGSLAAEERVAALKQWWRTARIDVALGRATPPAAPPTAATTTPTTPLEDASTPQRAAPVVLAEPEPEPDSPPSDLAAPDLASVLPALDDVLPVESAIAEHVADASGEEAEAEGADFENIFGEVDGEPAALEEAPGEPAPEANPETSDDGAEGEEYENIFGSDE